MNHQTLSENQDISCCNGHRRKVGKQAGAKLIIYLFLCTSIHVIKAGSIILSPDSIHMRGISPKFQQEVANVSSEVVASDVHSPTEFSWSLEKEGKLPDAAEQHQLIGWLFLMCIVIAFWWVLTPQADGQVGRYADSRVKRN